jgi:hypothetical protein
MRPFAVDGDLRCCSVRGGEKNLPPRGDVACDCVMGLSPTELSPDASKEANPSTNTIE